MKRPLSVSTVCVVLCVAALGGTASSQRSSPSGAGEMTQAATLFLGGLGESTRARAVFAFDGPERRDWRFVPGLHHGLALGDMTEMDRMRVRDLLRTGLSTRGMLTVEAVMAMESVLRELEHGNAARDPMKYSVAIFGTPGPGAWGWHFEGHHLSLNFTCRDNRVVSVTPFFVGSNPADVRTGPTAGLRILAQEEDLARSLVTSFTPEQRKQAVITEAAPADVLTVPGRPIDGVWPEPAVGLAASEMAAPQREILTELLNEYVHALRGGLADAEMTRITEAGMDKIRFCWAGSVEKGKGHYYRMVGPTFAIEYDNTQNDANHIHTVWHDRTRDFGPDVLAEHLKSDSGK